jgi:hypothetical protein
MTQTLSPNPAPRRQAARELGTSQHSARPRSRRGRRTRREHAPLARYTDSQGRPRELVDQQGSAGSVLVLDRDLATHGDERLVAHLAADEPPENAAIVARHYLDDEPGKRCRFRRPTHEDSTCAPFAEDDAIGLEPPVPPYAEAMMDPIGCSYRLGLVETGMSIPELRWCRHRCEPSDDAPEPVSMRDVVARLQSYEPVRTLSLQALAAHLGDGEVSTAVLRSELRRLQESPIVLNRGLREVTLAMIDRQALSMSEIAIRCGRVKHDSKGNTSGETSWLARRLGLLPEGGQSAPTPWVHSDVLALIARSGLGVSPREVELG